MRKLLILAGSLLGGTLAFACGDKVMLVMGSRSSQIKPVHPASILAYPGHSASAPLIRNLPSQPWVKKAGHRFQVVDDPQQLDAALKVGKYDVVVADIADAPGLSQEVWSAASKPVLLPVLYAASKEEQSAARKKFHCLLKAPASVDNYLDGIDQAIELKLKKMTR